MYSHSMAHPTQGPLKGHGALSNPPSRFNRDHVESVDDGWYTEEADSASLPVSLEPDRARSVISTNDSPDVGFDQSINPYRGCAHACVYCISPETPILMGDGRTRPISRVQVGDEIYGTARQGSHRRYVRTRVLARWSVVKPAYRIALEDGTQLIAGGDHRFLTDRGWKFVTRTMSTSLLQRPYLTTNNKLMGTGAYGGAAEQTADYRRGYLCGLIRGDGLPASDSYARVGREHGNQYHVRLALCDTEALERAQSWLAELSIQTHRYAFSVASATRRSMTAIRTHARGRADSIRDLIRWPDQPTREWHAGFLAGIFDSQGSYSRGILRISNTHPGIIRWLSQSLNTLNFRFVVEHRQRTDVKPIDVVRLLGGLHEHLRFLHTTDPAITRKRDICGQAVKSTARLRVTVIERLSGAMRLYDITTGTGDFIANGVVSHNCYARPSHAYLGLSPGLDFETRLFYKADAAGVLTDELARPGYVCKPVALGANTDPYQPLEKRLRVTRSILEVLRNCGHPVSIITKSSLILRDLDILRDLAGKRLVHVTVSVTTLDAELKRKLEPQAAAPQARLAAIRTLASNGVSVGALIAPVIPGLTDYELERIIEAVAEAGAVSAGYVLLRLPHEVKDLFRDWLAEHYPQRASHVMSLIHALRGGADNDPRFGHRMRGTGPLAELLRKRFHLACHRAGLEGKRSLPLLTTLFRRPGPQAELPLGL
jgi:DNA repair photolyase